MFLSLSAEELSIVDKIVNQGNALLGKKYGEYVEINGKNFMLDCVGTVSAIYYSVGLDIRKYFNNYQGGGVTRLFKTLKEKNVLHKNKLPEVGDLIFWDNTWDRNGDKILGNDLLTHAGMVVKIDEDETIHYLHANCYYGIVIEFMNLKRPTEYKDENGKIINSPLYIYSSFKKHPEHWLSGDLFNQYGCVLKVKEEFQLKNP